MDAAYYWIISQEVNLLLRLIFLNMGHDVNVCPEFDQWFGNINGDLTETYTPSTGLGKF